MRDPSDTSEAAPPVDDNLVSGVGMMLARALSGNLDWRSDEFMHGVAAEDRSEQISIRDKLTARFPKEFRKGDWNELLGAAKRELKSSGREGLDTDGQGNIRPTHDNAAKLLENDPAWRGVIKYNEFAGSVEFVKRAPSPVNFALGELKDHHDTEITRWFERKGCYIKSHTTHAVIESHARRNSYHPVREYLEDLEKRKVWDGKFRISTWLFDYCRVAGGTADFPNFLASKMGRKWLISAVARVMEPGCKADCMLVLEGFTGIRKSTTAAILGGPWFTDRLEDLSGKDAPMQVRGRWIVEMKELDKILKAERNSDTAVKGFLDSREDRLRPPFGRRVEEWKRQCVFIGTTETHDWMRSDTGRRYWPVRCEGTAPFDTDKLEADRDQLWAEALEAYRNGEKWHLESGDDILQAQLEQESRKPEDIYMTEVSDATEMLYTQRGHVHVEFQLMDVLQNCRTIKEGKTFDRHSPAVGRSLKTLGFEKRYVRRGSPSVAGNWYRRKGEWEEW